MLPLAVSQELILATLEILKSYSVITTNIGGWLQSVEALVRYLSLLSRWNTALRRLQGCRECHYLVRLNIEHGLAKMSIAFARFAYEMGEEAVILPSSVTQL